MIPRDRQGSDLNNSEEITTDQGGDFCDLLEIRRDYIESPGYIRHAHYHINRFDFRIA